MPNSVGGGAAGSLAPAFPPCPPVEREAPAQRGQSTDPPWGGAGSPNPPTWHPQSAAAAIARARPRIIPRRPAPNRRRSSFIFVRLEPHHPCERLTQVRLLGERDL